MNFKSKTTWRNLFLFFAALIYFLEGILFNPLALWNFVPLLIAYKLISNSLDKNSKSLFISFLIYCVLALGLLFLGHLAWYFDWQGTKTSSSTSALLLLFLPVYACIIGGTGYAICSFITKLIFKENDSLN